MVLWYRFLPSLLFFLGSYCFFSCSSDSVLGFEELSLLFGRDSEVRVFCYCVCIDIVSVGTRAGVALSPLLFFVRKVCFAFDDVIESMGEFVALCNTSSSCKIDLRHSDGVSWRKPR